MKQTILTPFLLIVSLHCQSCKPMIEIKLSSTDSVTYSLITKESTVLFVSNKDTIRFSQLSPINNSSVQNSLVKFDGKSFLVIHYPNLLSYEIKTEISSPSFVSYLDLPYDELAIDYGIYENPEIIKEKAHSEKYIHCSVIINNQPSKNQKKLKKIDWDKAEVRRKEQINSIAIVNSEKKTAYASAKRITSSNKETTFEVTFSSQCPKESLTLFKGALFMILWAYHDTK